MIFARVAYSIMLNAGYHLGSTTILRSSLHESRFYNLDIANPQNKVDILVHLLLRGVEVNLKSTNLCGSSVKAFT